MKLDSRIIEGKKPLDCFDTEIAKQFIGKKGFFGVHKSQFINLDTCPKCVNEILNKIDNYAECSFVTSGNYAYMYFLPEEWVKEPEKKYRPFTPDEFADTFTIGEPIIFRRKQSKRLYEYNVLFIGCCFLGDNTDVVLGNDRFSLETLFNNYEWRQHGSYDWKTFGMEE